MASSPRTCSSLYSTSTELCADAIESHPCEAGVFALGTYQVDKSELDAQTTRDDADPSESAASVSPTYSRRGRCTLRRIQRSQAGDTECNVATSIDGPAILDMKWTRSQINLCGSQSNVLGVADATGAVSLHSWDTSVASIVPSGRLLLNPRKALCLSLDWSDRRSGLSDDRPHEPIASLIVSQSDGTLAYLPDVETALEKAITSPESSMQTIGAAHDIDHAEQIYEHQCLNEAWDAKPRGLECWKAHGWEAWIAAWDCWSSGRVAWSGGDDLKLKGWDMRTSNGFTGREPTFTNEKSFEGGVTTAQSHHLRQHLWAVGSYDSHLRLFDARMPLRPLSSTNVGGGVWRLKWHPTDPTRLLAGCMHDGFKVLQLSSLAQDSSDAYSKNEMEITHRFDEHTSLAYGCDWVQGLDRGAASTVASCSFYDAQLHVWEA